MRIVDFKIDKDSQTMVYQREYVGEQTKMNIKYAIWNKKEILYFGITNEFERPLLGIEIKPQKDFILEHLKKIINDKEIIIKYIYLPPPPEEIGGGYMSELVLNPIITTLKFPNEVIEYLKQMIKIIEMIN